MAPWTWVGSFSGGHPGHCRALRRILGPTHSSQECPSSADHTSPDVVRCPLAAASAGAGPVLGEQLTLCCGRPSQVPWCPCPAHFPGHRSGPRTAWLPLQVAPAARMKGQLTACASRALGAPHQDTQPAPISPRVALSGRSHPSPSSSVWCELSGPETPVAPKWPEHRGLSCPAPPGTVSHGWDICGWSPLGAPGWGGCRPGTRPRTQVPTCRGHSPHRKQWPVLRPIPVPCVVQEQELRPNISQSRQPQRETQAVAGGPGRAAEDGPTQGRAEAGAAAHPGQEAGLLAPAQPSAQSRPLGPGTEASGSSGLNNETWPQ